MCSQLFVLSIFHCVILYFCLKKEFGMLIIRIHQFDIKYTLCIIIRSKVIIHGYSSIQKYSLVLIKNKQEEICIRLWIKTA